MEILVQWYDRLSGPNREQRRGNRVAIYSGDGRITYRTLLDRVNRARNALRGLGSSRKSVLRKST